eukprot:tig00000480_g1328.t1
MASTIQLPADAASALAGSTFIVTLAGKMVVDPATGQVKLDVNHADGFTMAQQGSMMASPALANVFQQQFQSQSQQQLIQPPQQNYSYAPQPGYAAAVQQYVPQPPVQQYTPPVQQYAAPPPVQQYVPPPPPPVQQEPPPQAPPVPVPAPPAPVPAPPPPAPAPVAVSPPGSGEPLTYVPRDVVPAIGSAAPAAPVEAPAAEAENPETFVPYVPPDPYGFGSGGVLSGVAEDVPPLPPPPGYQTAFSEAASPPPPPPAEARVAVNAALPPPPAAVAAPALAQGGFVTGGAAVSGAYAHFTEAPAAYSYSQAPPAALPPPPPPSPPPPRPPRRPACRPAPSAPRRRAAAAAAAAAAGGAAAPAAGARAGGGRRGGRRPQLRGGRSRPAPAVAAAPPPPPPPPAEMPSEDEIRAAAVHDSGSCSYGPVELTSSFGVISDGPEYYKNSDHCHWLIDPPGDAPVRLTVVAPHDIEPGYDFLKIFDGTTEDFPIASVSATSASEPFSVTSEMGAMFLSFEADYMGTRSGFVAAFESTEAAAQDPAASRLNLASAIQTAQQHAAAAAPAGRLEEEVQEGELEEAILGSLACEEGAALCDGPDDFAAGQEEAWHEC